MTIRNLLSTAVACVLAMTLAACGAGDDSSTAGATVGQSGTDGGSAGGSSHSTGGGTTTGGSTTGSSSSSGSGSGSTGSSGGSSASSLSLAASSYTIAQSSGGLTVSVSRSASASVTASVQFATADGTAVAGTDYTATSGALNWAAGDASAKTFTVPVSNASPFAGSRSFSIHLSGASSGATLGAPSSATATITGSGAVGTLAFSSASYAVAQSGAAVTASVNRSAGSVGAVSVQYATTNGSAVAGTDYSAASGTLNWAAGDASAKSFTVPVSNATPFSGSRSFTLTLSGSGGGATLGTPSSASAIITGSGAVGTLALSSASYTVAQSSGPVAVTVNRSGGSVGAVSVQYATTNGSAVAGTDYTAASGTLNWAAGDASAKSFSVPISNATPFNGSRSFAIALSSTAGGATLGSPSTATATITGGGCAQTASSYVTTGLYDAKQYGVYLVNNNNWGGTPGQQLWANNQGCWGVTTTATTDGGGIGSYPSVTRGWTQNGILQTLSTPGSNDWTTRAGLGIPVAQLTKAKIHWTFNAPTTPGIRWMGLQDIYFHPTATPADTDWPPFVDLMIDQALGDQVVGNSTFYALVATQSHGTTVTIGGNTYLVYIDASGETSFHQPGGHNIHLFNLPTAYTSNSANPAWGVMNAVNDVAPIVQYFMQSNPVDNNGHPLMDAAGNVVISPLIASNLFLTAINSGWEIDDGTVFTTTGFCVAMQSEPDCP